MQHNTQTRTTNKSLPTDKFLTIAVNLINTAVLEAERTKAKGIYRDLMDGKAVALTHLQMEDESLVRFDLALNHARYRGKLTYRNFRIGITHLLSNIANELRTQPEKLRVYRNQNDPNSVMFGVNAVTVEDGKPSMLVLGADSFGGEARVLLQLMYLDHLQFEEDLPPVDDNAVG
jgi:hypothetical protein